MLPLLLTTNPGLEDVVEGEIRALAVTAEVGVRRVVFPYEDRPGQVLIDLETDHPTAVVLARRMRSIHHILRPIARLTVAEESPMIAMRGAAAGLDIPELHSADRFRVTGIRKGAHDFTSTDLQRSVGAGIIDTYGTAVGLKDFDIEIRADVLDDRCDIGVQITHRALSKRQQRPYRPRTAIKANVAFSMLWLAAPDQAPEVLLDPFCGSGTILVEAAALFPTTRLIGSEMFEKPLNGARQNLEHLGVAAEVRKADGRVLDETLPAGCVDLIVTNPPFGVRLGGRANFDWFYTRLLAGAVHVLRPGGRIALLAWHRGALDWAIERNRYLHSMHVRTLQTGGLCLGFYLLERRAEA